MVCLAAICSHLHGAPNLSNGRDIRNTDKPMLQYVESHNDDVTEVGFPTFDHIFAGLSLHFCYLIQIPSGSCCKIRPSSSSSRSIIVFWDGRLPHNRYSTMYPKLSDHAANHPFPRSSTFIPRTPPDFSPAARMASSTSST